MEFSLLSGFPPMLWKKIKIFTASCGKKKQPLQGIQTVFHITFLYGYFYYLNFLFFLSFRKRNWRDFR